MNIIQFLMKQNARKLCVQYLYQYIHKIERVQYNLKIVNTELSNFQVIDYSV